MRRGEKSRFLLKPMYAFKELGSPPRVPPAATGLSFLFCQPKCVVPENIHTHPMEGHWKFLGVGGGGVLKAKFQKQCMKIKTYLEFHGGGGVQNRKHLWVKYEYFLELHNDHDVCNSPLSKRATGVRVGACSIMGSFGGTIAHVKIFLLRH